MTRQESAPVLERMTGTRVVGRELSALLSDSDWPSNQVTLQFASDELLTFGELDPSLVFRHDPHAIVAREARFFGVWLSREAGTKLMETHCEWTCPGSREFPTQAQGAVAGIPTKIWFTKEKWLFVVQSPYVLDFEERVQ